MAAWVALVDCPTMSAANLLYPIAKRSNLVLQFLQAPNCVSSVALNAFGSDNHAPVKMQRPAAQPSKMV